MSVLLYRFFLVSDHITLAFVPSSSQFGCLPIHRGADNRDVEAVRMLLEYDPYSVSVQNKVS